jgi:peroxiredoxin
VLTESAQLTVGSAAPAFALPEPLTGKVVRSDDFQGKALLVMVLSNHCP